jgi:hypothetical protein
MSLHKHSPPLCLLPVFSCDAVIFIKWCRSLNFVSISTETARANSGKYEMYAKIFAKIAFFVFAKKYTRFSRTFRENRGFLFSRKFLRKIYEIFAKIGYFCFRENFRTKFVAKFRENLSIFAKMKKCIFVSTLIRTLITSILTKIRQAAWSTR